VNVIQNVVDAKQVFSFTWFKKVVQRSIQDLRTWWEKALGRERSEVWPGKQEGVSITPKWTQRYSILERRRNRWETLQQTLQSRGHVLTCMTRHSSKQKLQVVSQSDEFRSRFRLSNRGTLKNNQFEAIHIRWWQLASFSMNKRNKPSMSQSLNVTSPIKANGMAREKA